MFILSSRIGHPVSGKLRFGGPKFSIPRSTPGGNFDEKFNLRKILDLDDTHHFDQVLKNLFDLI
jgi:hypothetical protein